MTKVRIALSKGEAVRYTSHLDTMRMLIRAIRRADLPIAYTNGFNKHPILSFLLPLPLGITSDFEPVDLSFEGEICFAEIQEKLSAVLPNGFSVVSIGTPGCPVNEVFGATYEIQLFFDESVDTSLLPELLLSQAPLLTEKKSKKGMRKVDVRPLLFDFSWSEHTKTLTTTLACGTEQNLNPGLLLQAITETDPRIAPLYFKAHRCSIQTKNQKPVILK